MFSCVVAKTSDKGIFILKHCMKITFIAISLKSLEHILFGLYMGIRCVLSQIIQANFFKYANKCFSENMFVS